MRRILNRKLVFSVRLSVLNETEAELVLMLGLLRKDLLRSFLNPTRQ